MTLRRPQGDDGCWRRWMLEVGELSELGRRQQLIELRHDSFPRSAIIIITQPAKYPYDVQVIS